MTKYLCDHLHIYSRVEKERGASVSGVMRGQRLLYSGELGESLEIKVVLFVGDDGQFSSVLAQNGHRGTHDQEHEVRSRFDALATIYQQRRLCVGI